MTGGNTMDLMGSPGDDTWVDLLLEPLPVATVADWAVLPRCGALVVFTGTVRDHAEGRPGVSSLEYEAYTGQVEPRLAGIADEARCRWPELGRIALLHRTGLLEVGEASVVVAVSAPHRAEAFAAARFCIDTVKVSVPIWKREAWDGGRDWAATTDGADGADVGPRGGEEAVHR
ncbi:MAG: molybdenum cofactor biosynthesis protein MoaE [Actinomycetota bacterium]|nr:molybdenum cofactor biosynthesis protein MoaE [Actinomycetota bacterium]